MYEISDKSKLRNEKKFVFLETSNFLEKYFQSINAVEQFPQRKVNSIYFDTIYHRNLIDAIEGEKLRNKTRLRWYGKIFNSNIKSNLEKKIKIDQHNYKIIKKIKSFQTTSIFNLQKFNQYIVNQMRENDELYYYLNNLYPNILVSYSRKYFKYKDIRITVDSDLHFINLAKINIFTKNSFSNFAKNNIVEIKYSDDYHKQALFVTKMFTNRLNKFSKYQVGYFQTL